MANPDNFINDKNIIFKPRTNIFPKSTIINKKHVLILKTWLPNNIANKMWEKIYTASIDGYIKILF
jgi:hypothetical protein